MASVEAASRSASARNLLAHKGGQAQAGRLSCAVNNKITSHPRARSPPANPPFQFLHGGPSLFYLLPSNPERRPGLRWREPSQVVDLPFEAGALLLEKTHARSKSGVEGGRRGARTRAESEASGELVPCASEPRPLREPHAHVPQKGVEGVLAQMRWPRQTVLQQARCQGGEGRCLLSRARVGRRRRRRGGRGRAQRRGRCHDVRRGSRSDARSQRRRGISHDRGRDTLARFGVETGQRRSQVARTRTAACLRLVQKRGCDDFFVEQRRGSPTPRDALPGAEIGKALQRFVDGGSHSSLD